MVSVDDFKQGTLAEAIDLVNKETFKTEEGAIHLIERIWVSDLLLHARRVPVHDGRGEFDRRLHKLAQLAEAYGTDAWSGKCSVLRTTARHQRSASTRATATGLRSGARPTPTRCSVSCTARGWWSCLRAPLRAVRRLRTWMLVTGPLDEQEAAAARKKRGERTKRQRRERREDHEAAAALVFRPSRCLPRCLILSTSIPQLHVGSRHPQFSPFLPSPSLAFPHHLLSPPVLARPNAQIERAEQYYKKALELVPEHCEATSYMGELYIQINDFDQVP